MLWLKVEAYWNRITVYLELKIKQYLILSLSVFILPARYADPVYSSTLSAYAC